VCVCIYGITSRSSIRFCLLFTTTRFLLGVSSVFLATRSILRQCLLTRFNSIPATTIAFISTFFPARDNVVSSHDDGRNRLFGLLSLIPSTASSQRHAFCTFTILLFTGKSIGFYSSSSSSNQLTSNRQRAVSGLLSYLDGWLDQIVRVSSRVNGSRKLGRIKLAKQFFDFRVFC
jgi:hypothetical protein